MSKNISLTDEEKDDELKNDNIHPPTNIFCIIIIFLIIYLTFIFIKNIFVYNKSIKINQVYDSNGNGCGLGKLKDFNYLYFINFELPYKSVCVKNCVKVNYNAVKYNYTNDNVEPLYYNEFHNLIKNSKIEKNNSMNITNKVYEEKWSYYFTEEQWENYSKKYKVDCYENENIPSCNYSENKDFIIYDSKKEYFPICIPLNKRIKKLSLKLTNSINLNLFFAIIYNKNLIMYSGIISLLLGIYFLVLIKYFSKFIIWIVILLSNTIFLFIGIYLQLTIYFKGYFYDLLKKFNENLADLIINYSSIFFVFSLLMILIGNIILIISFRIKKKIKTLFNLTVTASTIVLKNFSNIIFNILFTIIKLFWIYFTIIIWYKIYSNKKILEKIDYQYGIPFLIYQFEGYKIFEIFEILFFSIFFYRFFENIIIFNQISLVINHFYNRDRNGIINFFYIILNHIGTITLYSLLFFINIVQFFLKIFTFGLIPFNNYFLNITELPFGIVYFKGENYFKSVDIFVDLLNNFGNHYSLVFIFSKLIYYFVIFIITIVSGKINISILLYKEVIIENNFDLNYIYFSSYILSFIIAYSIMSNFYYSIMGLVICFLVDVRNIDASINEEAKIIFEESKINSKLRKKYTQLS